MTYAGSNEPRQTKNERREAAREKARILREEQRKRERRNRFLLQGGIIVAVVGIAALIGGLIFSSIQPAGPGPRNMASDGILMVAGEEGGMTVVETAAIPADGEPTPTTPDESGEVANIVIYQDYLCPVCKAFDETNRQTIQTLVESGAATYEVHPMSILTNRSAGTKYSLRAANAAACVADNSPEAFWDFDASLFVNQPEEYSTGLTNDELKSLAAEAGATNVDSCIDSSEFASWAEAANNRALAGPLPNTEYERVRGTPTVLVNGQHYQGAIDDPAEFQAFVQQAIGSTLTDQSGEPSASPTPTPTP